MIPKTILMIAHSLESIASAAEIIVMKIHVFFEICIFLIVGDRPSNFGICGDLGMVGHICYDIFCRIHDKNPVGMIDKNL